MTISLKHAFTSPVADEGHPDEVGPDEWNAEHVLTQATGKLLGRSTASTGATEEITPDVTLSLSGGSLGVVNGNLTKVDDTNVTLTLGGTPTGALLKATSITVGWTGTLAAGRLNSNVVQGVTNDTNVTGSIAAQVLTLGWTGTLAVARGGTGGGSASGTLLDNITGFSSTGVLTRTASGTYAFRTIASGTGISVTNGDGVSGNPSIALDTTHARNALHPASSTDNAIARYDSTAGALQNSGVTIDDSNNMVLPAAAQLFTDGLTSALDSTSSFIVGRDNFAQIEIASHHGTTGNAALLGFRSRGTRSSPTIVAADDFLFSFFARGYDGGAYRNAAGVRFQCDTTPGSSDMPGRATIHTTADGAAALTERLRIDSAGAISHRAAATTIFDANSHLGLRSYTVATLPSASTAAQMIYVSDETGGAVPCFSDGTNWRRVTDRAIAA